MHSQLFKLLALFAVATTSVFAEGDDCEGYVEEAQQKPTIPTATPVPYKTPVPAPHPTPALISNDANKKAPVTITKTVYACTTSAPFAKSSNDANIQNVASSTTHTPIATNVNYNLVGNSANSIEVSLFSTIGALAAALFAL